MISIFPIPHDGELFFSVLCRLYERMDKPAPTAFAKVLFGAGTANPGTTIALHLDKIEKILPPGYPLNIEAIRKRHSLEPFILNFATPSKKQKYVLDTHLKSCPECRNEDKTRVGAAYWHTIHQVEGIQYCLHHKCPLQIAKRPSLRKNLHGRSFQASYFSPSDSEMLPLEDISNVETHIAFTRMVQDIIDGKALPWEVRLASLWGEMERQGFTTGRQVKGWQVLEAGAARFGKDMQNLFQMPTGPRGRRVITNVLTKEDLLPHRTLFLHCLTNLPIWQEVAPAKREYIDFRQNRADRERVPQESHAKRKKFRELLKGRLPKDLSELDLYKDLAQNDAKWLNSFQSNEAAKKAKTANYISTNDPEAAAHVKRIADEIKKRPECPIWIKSTIIIREAKTFSRMLLRCRNAPLTKAAFEEVTETKEDIVNRRVEWAKTQIPPGETIAAYEFKALAKVRGLKNCPQLPGAFTRQGWQDKKAEKASVMRKALDPEAAALVKTAAQRLRARPGRPEWIKFTGIVREVGNDGEIIEICRQMPFTRQALKEECDTHKSMYARRLAWARTHHPAIDEMAHYDKKCFLGMRGWKTVPSPEQVISPKTIKTPYENLKTG